MDLIGLTQIAELLGMTRAGAHKLVGREATFPHPVSVLANKTRVWERADVERWAIEECRVCPEHRRTAIGKQTVAGILRGRCSDDFLYHIDPRMVPQEPGADAKTPQIPWDLGLENYRG